MHNIFMDICEHLLTLENLASSACGRHPQWLQADESILLQLLLYVVKKHRLLVKQHRLRVLMMVGV